MWDPRSPRCATAIAASAGTSAATGRPSQTAGASRTGTRPATCSRSSSIWACGGRRSSGCPRAAISPAGGRAGAGAREALVFVASSARREDPDKEGLYHAMLETWERDGLRPELAQAIATIVLGADWDGSAAWIEKWQRMDVSSLRGTLEPLFSREDFTSRLGELDHPALVIWGDQDAAVSGEHARGGRRSAARIVHGRAGRRPRREPHPPRRDQPRADVVSRRGRDAVVTAPLEPPAAIAATLRALDEFIETEIRPLELSGDNARFFDHRREWARTDFERDGLPSPSGRSSSARCAAGPTWRAGCAGASRTPRRARRVAPRDGLHPRAPRPPRCRPARRCLYESSVVGNFPVVVMFDAVASTTSATSGSSRWSRASGRWGSRDRARLRLRRDADGGAGRRRRRRLGHQRPQTVELSRARRLAQRRVRPHLGRAGRAARDHRLPRPHRRAGLHRRVLRVDDEPAADAAEVTLSASRPGVGRARRGRRRGSSPSSTSSTTSACARPHRAWAPRSTASTGPSRTRARVTRGDGGSAPTKPSSSRSPSCTPRRRWCARSCARPRRCSTSARRRARRISWRCATTAQSPGLRRRRPSDPGLRRRRL